MGTLPAWGFCLQESDLVGADPLPCPLLCPDLGLLFASTSSNQELSIPTQNGTHVLFP